MKAMADARYTFDFEKKELKKIEQKPAEWSEEDEEFLRRAIKATKDVYPVTANWLKSLKDRVQPQNITVTDEELAQAKKDAYNDALNKIEYHSGEPSFDDGWSAAIWYLKKRNMQQQPKQEWSEEDEGIYQSIMDDTIQENQLDEKQIDWLRNIKYRNFARPQKQWKPSKDQMNALKWILMNVPYCKHKEEIDGLLEQLKQL